MSNFQSFRLNGVARIEKTHTNTHTHTQTYIHTHKHTVESKLGNIKKKTFFQVTDKT